MVSIMQLKTSMQLAEDRIEAYIFYNSHKVSLLFRIHQMSLLLLLQYLTKLAVFVQVYLKQTMYILRIARILLGVSFLIARPTFSFLEYSI